MILQCLERGLEKHLQLETDETVIDSLSGADHLQLEMNPNTALGDPPEALIPSAFEVNLLTDADIVDVRAMIREARAQGPSVLDALRRVFPPEVWALASA